jgi:AraC-like DNA-binding protein
MSDRPEVEDFQTVDLLTEVMADAGLRRRLLDSAVLPREGELRFPCSKSLGLHVVLRGSVDLLATSLEAPLRLQAGDVALMARGCEHRLAAVPPLQAAPADALAPAVLSGAYQFWHTPVHPLFAQLPDWTVLRADAQPRLGPLALTTALLAAEVERPGLGGQSLGHALLDAALTYALREVLQQPAGAGWALAIQDPRVRRAVELMHADSARPWTLHSLAQAVGLSRTALAQRFRDTLGDTPLNHLRSLRMQKAMRQLSETDDTLDRVAQQVGYQDAFGFSKVFKRTVGVAPREFRRRNAAEQHLPWRF